MSELGQHQNFYLRIRSQEVPLNFLFNLLLSWSSPNTIAGIIERFGLNDENFYDEQFALLYPWEGAVAQPDVRIESEKVRIFIEIKVGASIKLEQVQRYLLLHAEMNIREGKKKPYLLFLTDSEFKKCWSPRRETVGIQNVQDFLKGMVNNLAIPGRLARKLRNQSIVAEYETVKREARYQAIMWKSLALYLVNTASQRRAQAPGDIEIRILNGFLSDLRLRGFLD